MERVIFLKEKKTEDNESENVFAFFPDSKWNDVDYVSYAHIGQHGPCSKDYAKECKGATQEEYEDLKNELYQIGYKQLLIVDAKEWNNE